MLALRLAEQSGQVEKVDAMLARMTPEQLGEWQAKDLLEPIGNWRTLAYMVATLMSFQGSKIKPGDIVHWRPKPDETEQSADAIEDPWLE